MLPEAEEVAQKLNITLDEYYKILQSAHSGIMLRFEEFSRKTGGECGFDLEEIIPDPNMKTLWNSTRITKKGADCRPRR